MEMCYNFMEVYIAYDFKECRMPAFQKVVNIHVECAVASSRQSDVSKFICMDGWMMDISLLEYI